MTDEKTPWPMTIKGVKLGEGVGDKGYGTNALIPSRRQSKGPTMVSIRPCGEEYGGKTYFGYLLGDMAHSFSTKQDPEDGKLAIEFSFYNPAMYVPELGEVIYGMGSWWGVIKNEADLKRITDNDISNVWYVKALLHMQGDAPTSEFVYTEHDEEDEECPPGFSAVWVNYREAWLKSKTHTACDTLRTDNMLEAHPGFGGSDDMEGHFEFKMTQDEMKAHLATFGIANTADLIHPSDKVNDED